ncbi:MAG: lytic transglycosylase domain-containing protein [Bacteroidales bacterium]|nr:lytic transglycosylase domain-containing protein [Bacteroidales bacterium]
MCRRIALRAAAAVCVSITPCVMVATFAPLPARAQDAPVRQTSDHEAYAEFIVEAARRFDLPAALLQAVIRAESGGDARAVSPAGTLGLMQITPDVWSEARAKLALGADPFDPRDNILAGAAYLRALRDRFGTPGFLAAYRLRPEQYQALLKSGRTLPGEAQDYVAALVPFVAGNSTAPLTPSPIEAAPHRAEPPSWTRAPLFVTHGDGASTAASVSADRHPNDASDARSVRDLTAITPQPQGLFVAPANHGERP